MDEMDFKQILTEFPDCVTNGAKLKAILLDTYPDISKAIVNTLVIMVNSGIAKEIQDSGQVTTFELSRWRIKLEDDFGLSGNFIEIGLNIWVKTINDLRYKDFQILEGKLVKYTGSSRVVLIPDGIKYIADGSFKNCVNIENIIIPEGVEYIGDYAFENCFNLENISLPQSLQKIGYNAFWHCPKLKTTILDNIYYIGNSNNPYLIALKGEKELLVQCALPQSTKIIYSNAFMDCVKLKSIKLPQLYYIGISAFTGCEELKDILAEKCVVIDEYAFSYCKQLRTVSIGSVIKYIGSYAFENCRSITKLDFIKPLMIKKNIFGENLTNKVKLGVCHDLFFPFYCKYNENFRSAYERYIKHDIFADYSDLGYTNYDIEDEQDLLCDFRQPSYSYLIEE